MTITTRKVENLYFAAVVDSGIFSYGDCQDEAFNNLIDELAARQGASIERGAHVVS